MVFCKQEMCKYWDNDKCTQKDIHLDEDGICDDYSQDFWKYWERLDDIEREEYNRCFCEEEEEERE